MSSGSSVPLGRLGVGALFLVALWSSACVDRERPSFLGPNNGLGPVIDIQVPSRDTTVVLGSNVLVAGLAVDLDGVDVVIFDVIGVNFTLPPLNTDADTVLFSFTVPTSGLAAGDTVTIGIFGFDLLGERGDTAFRRVVLQ